MSGSEVGSTLETHMSKGSACRRQEENGSRQLSSLVEPVWNTVRQCSMCRVGRFRRTDMDGLNRLRLSAVDVALTLNPKP